MFRLCRVVSFFVAAAAAVVLIFTAHVGAQLQGGPLWWVPDNDTSWSRHHDRWFISPVEVAATGAATSFPVRTWISSEQRGYLTSAPPNAACDYLNGNEYDLVGPPDRNRQASMRTSRTRAEWGGAGGLQQSLHIGDYWQGRVFNDYMTHPASRATHRALYPGWDPFIYGSFDVRTRNRFGYWVSPLTGGSPWVRFPSTVGGPFHLRGGGGMTLGCVGFALVMMHGAGDGTDYGVYPATFPPTSTATRATPPRALSSCADSPRGVASRTFAPATRPPSGSTPCLIRPPSLARFRSWFAPSGLPVRRCFLPRTMAATCRVFILISWDGVLSSGSSPSRSSLRPISIPCPGTCRRIRGRTLSPAVRGFSASSIPLPPMPSAASLVVSATTPARLLPIRRSRIALSSAPRAGMPPPVPSTRSAGLTTTRRPTPVS